MKIDDSPYVRILRAHFQLDAEEYLNRLTDHFIIDYFRRRFPKGYCSYCNSQFRDY